MDIESLTNGSERVEDGAHGAYSVDDMAGTEAVRACQLGLPRAAPPQQRTLLQPTTTHTPTLKPTIPYSMLYRMD